MLDTENRKDEQQKSLGNALLTTLIVGVSFAGYVVYKRLSRDMLIRDKNGCVIKLSKSQWNEFWENGYVKIGKTMTDNECDALIERVNDIMNGKINYGDKLMMQLDPSAKTSVKNEHEYHKNNIMSKGQSTGFKGATQNYRKIGETHAGLECDNLFRAFATKDVFRDICGQVYGPHTSISVYRAMIFNKPKKFKKDNNDVGGGTFLPWHQDGGGWWALDRDPLIFCWTALEDCNKDNGCVEVIKGSYKLGILSNEGHMLDDNDVNKYCNSGEYVIEDMITKKGETWLVHNWTIHRSGISNSYNKSRMAFSCNYIDSRTKVLNPKPNNCGPLAQTGKSFHVLFPSQLNK